MEVLITKCSDSSYWYRQHLGETFKVIKEGSGYYWVRDHDGFRNMIEKKDAIPLSDEPLYNSIAAERKTSDGSTAESALNTQVGGDHYKKYRMQPMEIAYDYKLTNAIFATLKYILRYRDKNGKQDLEKAIHCLQMAIELEYPEEL
jgi:hypothetical protein